MIHEIIKYTKKITANMYIIGVILFFTIIGLIPLFGYAISTSQERIKNGVNADPPNIQSIFSLTYKGIVGIGIIILMLLPSGLIYLSMPILIDLVDIGESTLLTGLMGLIAILGLLFALSGLYLFSAMIFAYSRYSVDDRLSLTNSIVSTIINVSLSKKYFTVFMYVMALSVLYGIFTQILFFTIIFAPFVGILALIYFSALGYVIGSLTTEFGPVLD